MSLSFPSSRELYTKLPKLTDSDNYARWKYAIEPFLKLDGLWRICQGTETETDPAKLRRLNLAARARLILTVDPEFLEFVTGEKTAKGTWDMLRHIFEDHSWDLRVHLTHQLREAVHNLEHCTSLEEYVNPVMEVLQKMRNAGVETLDDFGSCMLLAGLDDRFDPMIRSMDNSDTKMTLVRIKKRLLRVDMNALRPLKNTKKIYRKASQ